MRWSGLVALAFVASGSFAESNTPSSVSKTELMHIFVDLRTENFGARSASNSPNSCQLVRLKSDRETIAKGPELIDALAARLDLTKVSLKSVGADPADPLGVELTFTDSKYFESALVWLPAVAALLFEGLVGEPVIRSPRAYAAFDSSLPWDLDRIDQPQNELDDTFKPLGKGDGVRVYLLDSGVRASHSEFRRDDGSSLSRVSNLKDHYDGLIDRIGHGTFVAALIGGKRYGVAPKAQIVSLKVLGDDGTAKASAVATALDELARSGEIDDCSVINLSLWGPESRMPRCPIEQLLNQGAMIVGAAGNANGADAARFFPGHYPFLIIVGSSTKGDRVALHSSIGNRVDIFAPGVAVRSAGVKSDDDTAIHGGTTAAAALVSGVVAAYLSTPPKDCPNMRNIDVLECIIQRASRKVKESSRWYSPEVSLVRTKPEVFYRPLVYVGSGLNGSSATAPARGDGNQQPIGATSTDLSLEPPDWTPLVRLFPRTPFQVSGSLAYGTVSASLEASDVDGRESGSTQRTADRAGGYGPIDSILDRENRLTLGYASRRISSWQHGSSLELASLASDHDGWWNASRGRATFDFTYDAGVSTWGVNPHASLFLRDGSPSHASRGLTLSYARTPGAGGDCTPTLLGVYADYNKYDQKRGNTRRVFDQSGTGGAVSLRFMHEVRARGTACAYGTLFSAPNPSTRHSIDVWAGVHDYEADGRAWDSHGWFIRGKSTIRIPGRSLYLEPAFVFARSAFENTLTKSERTGTDRGSGKKLAPGESSAFDFVPDADWELANRFQKDRGWSLTTRYTVRKEDKFAIDFSLSFARERSRSNVDFLSEGRKIIQFTVTVRPINVLGRKWGGATGGGTTIIGVGGPSGGPRPDPTVNCTNPPCPP